MAGKKAESAIVADRAALLTAVQVASVVGSKLDIPILNNMLVESDGAGLCLTATNMDVEVRARIDAKCEGAPIATTVAAKRLQALVGASDEGCQISLSLGGEANRMTVAAGRGRYQLPLLPSADFPRIAFTDGGASLSLRAGDLAAALDRTSFAESKDGARYYLQGTCLAPVEGKLFAVATNGYVVTEIELGDVPEGWESSILPSRLTALLIRLLKDSDDDLTIARDPQGERVRLCWGDWTVTAKLVQGTFPTWRVAMPQPRPDREVVVDSGALRQAIRRATQVQAEKSELVVVEFAKDRLIIRCESPEYGLGEEEVGASGDVEDFRIGFNAGYLRDLAAAASDDTIVIEPPLTAERGKSGAETGTRITAAARKGFDSTLMLMAI